MIVKILYHLNTFGEFFLFFEITVHYHFQSIGSLPHSRNDDEGIGIAYIF